jgi:hypothetical protein
VRIGRHVRIPESAVTSSWPPAPSIRSTLGAAEGGLMPNEMGRRRRFGSVRQLRSGRYQARYQGPDGLPRTAPKTFDIEADALR